MPRRKRTAAPDDAAEASATAPAAPEVEAAAVEPDHDEAAPKLSRRQQRALQKAAKADAAPAEVPTTDKQAARPTSDASEQQQKRLAASVLPRAPCFVNTGTLEQWVKRAVQSGAPGDLHFVTQRQFTSGMGPSAQPPRLNAAVVKGIQNHANACYIAGVLQALVHCPPIASLLVAAHVASQARSKLTGDGKTPTASVPLAAQLGEWVLRYWASSTVAAVPLPPCFSGGAVRLGGGVAADGVRQEDAGEFLQSLLKAVDASLVAVGVKSPTTAAGANSKQSVPPPAAARGATTASGTERGWLTVGKGKEKLTVRTDGAGAAGNDADAAVAANLPPLAGQVLQGTLRVNTKNAKGTARGVTAVVVEPFVTIAVPVSAPNRTSPGSPPTVADCLTAALAKESVDGGDGRDIRRNALFGTMPSVLIVQLSRWAVTREGDVVKLSNRVQLAPTLTVPKALIHGAAAGAEYKLQSVVCHRGDMPGSGHYVTYVVNGTTVAAPAPGGSGRDATIAIANDSRVQRAPLTQGLCEAEDDSPYLLLYSR